MTIAIKIPKKSAEDRFLPKKTRIPLGQKFKFGDTRAAHPES